MDAKWKINWDFLGWKDKPIYDSISQKDWNQTLVTRINEISAQIHMATLRGGANRVYLHPKSFMLIKDFEYYQYDEKTNRKLIGNRYEIFIDDKLPMDKIYVKYHEELFEKFLAHDPDYRMIITTLNENSEFGYSESMITFLTTKNEDFEGYVNNKQSKIISKELLTGEITILNHNTIDPVTGEILVDYHTEISEDLWIPSPERVIGHLVDVLPGATIEERTKKIKELLIKSKTLINKPEIKEEQKEIKLTLLQRLANIINKTK